MKKAEKRGLLLVVLAVFLLSLASFSVVHAAPDTGAAVVEVSAGDHTGGTVTVTSVALLQPPQPVTDAPSVPGYVWPFIAIGGVAVLGGGCLFLYVARGNSEK